MRANINLSRLFRIGTAAFCFMCLFFAISMASKYEHQKTQTESHLQKIKELEKKVNELSRINQELSQMRHSLVQEKEQLAKEIHNQKEKSPETESWKLTHTQEDALTTIQPDNKTSNNKSDSSASSE